MSRISAENIALIVKRAAGLNYFGKRLDDKKNEVAEKISMEIFGTSSRSAEELREESVLLHQDQ